VRVRGCVALVVLFVLLAGCASYEHEAKLKTCLLCLTARVSTKGAGDVQPELVKDTDSELP
jgi:hypothetical protein